MRMVVGHTPQEAGINSALGGRLWRTDTGMTAMIGGQPEVSFLPSFEQDVEVTPTRGEYVPPITYVLCHRKVCLFSTHRALLFWSSSLRRYTLSTGPTKQLRKGSSKAGRTPLTFVEK